MGMESIAESIIPMLDYEPNEEEERYFTLTVSVISTG
jgi:hypothetical protein